MVWGRGGREGRGFKLVDRREVGEEGGRQSGGGVVRKPGGRDATLILSANYSRELSWGRTNLGEGYRGSAACRRDARRAAW